MLESRLVFLLQEIIQNADDAGAKQVIFYLDNRDHPTDSLIAQGLKRFQGPALLAFNGARFTTADWESIQKPEQSGKEKDPFKVGKFGLGFNSVYHITGEFL
jgi:sacsin